MSDINDYRKPLTNDLRWPGHGLGVGYQMYPYPTMFPGGTTPGDGLAEKVKDLSSRLEALEAASKIHDGDKLEPRPSGISACYKSAERDIEDLQEDLEEAYEANDGLWGTIGGLRGQIGDLEVDLKDANDTIAALLRQNDHLRNDNVFLAASSGRKPAIFPKL